MKGTDSWLYIVVQVALHVYFAGAIAFLVLIQNQYPVETYFREIPYGELFSLRGNSFQWTLSFLSTFKLLMVPMLCLGLMFRKSRRCSIGWMLVIVTLVFLDLVVILGLGRFYSNCNASGQVDNPCNNELWCCAPEIYSEAVNKCPRSTGPCSELPVLTVKQLYPNVDFLWLFFSNVVFFAFDLFFFVLFLGIIPPSFSTTTTTMKWTKSQ